MRIAECGRRGEGKRGRSKEGGGWFGGVQVSRASAWGRRTAALSTVVREVQGKKKNPTMRKDRCAARVKGTTSFHQSCRSAARVVQRTKIM